MATDALAEEWLEASLDEPPVDRGREEDQERAQSLETDPDSSSFELFESFAIPMPRDFTPSGISVSESGEVLAWARGHAVLHVVDSGGTEPIRLDEPVQVLAASLSDRHVEVLDADRGVLMIFDRSSGSLQEMNLPAGHVRTSAAKVGDAWIVGGRGLDGEFHVSRWDYGSESTQLAVLPDGELMHHVSGSETEVLLTRARDPFQVVRLEPVPEIRPTLLASPMNVPEIRESVDEFWVSLPAVHLDDGYLQGLSDTRSDRRILVLYDSDGGIRKTQKIEIPMAFVASLPRRRMLFGARRIDGAEVVAYEWSWKAVDHTPPSKEE